MKDYDTNKDSLPLKYWHINNLYGRAMLPKLPVNGCKWIEYLSKFEEGLIKSYYGKSKEEYFLDIDVYFSEN